MTIVRGCPICRANIESTPGAGARGENYRHFKCLRCSHEWSVIRRQTTDRQYRP